jgi:hypothetical protein
MEEIIIVMYKQKEVLDWDEINNNEQVRWFGSNRTTVGSIYLKKISVAWDIDKLLT